MKKSLIFILLGILTAMIALIVDSAVNNLPGWVLLTAAGGAALLLILGFVCRHFEKKK